MQSHKSIFYSQENIGKQLDFITGTRLKKVCTGPFLPVDSIPSFVNNSA